MTTVGYGDKTPRTFWGRIFSVFWISTGIIASGLLTGIVVAEVMKINSPPPHDMKGENIGSLLYRDYDAMMVAQNGGLLYPLKTPTPEPVDFFEDAFVMIDNLRRKKIKGFVMDLFTYWMLHTTGAGFVQKLDFTKYKLITREDALKSINYCQSATTMKTIKYQGSDRLTYGILVRQKKHFDYLVDMVKYTGKVGIWRAQISWNQYVSKTVLNIPDDLKISRNVSEEEMHLYIGESNNLFSHKAFSFKISVGVICCIIVCIIVVGSVLEYRRTGGNKRYMCIRETVDEDKGTDVQSGDVGEKKMVVIES